MLKMKEGAVDVKDVSAAKSNLGSQEMTDVFWPLYNDDPASEGTKWRKMLDVKNDKLGYSGQVFQAPSTNSPMDVVRMELTFKNANKEQWFEMLKYGPPIKNLKSCDVIKEVSDRERYLRLVVKLPIMTARE